MADYILITHGTRPLAQRLARQLPEGKEVLFGAADEMSDVLLRTGHYVRLPGAKSPAFAHEMLKICLDYGVSLLLPLGREEQLALLEAKILFEEYGIAVLLPEKSVFDVVPRFEDPSVGLPFLILEKGRLVGQYHERYEGTDAGFSGVFVQSDSGQELAFCAISG